MKFPSSNTDGANPAHGDIVSNVGSSHGTRLSGGSTGAIVTATGDDANITLKVAGKGTGETRIGNSSSPVVLSGPIGSSGSVLTEMRAFTVQFTAPALSSGAATASAESTVTVTGVSTGTVLVFTPTNPIGAGYGLRVRCSTANELTMAWQLAASGASTIGTGESTNRGTLLQFRF